MMIREIRYTTAPREYDYPYTVELSRCVGMLNGLPVRLVSLDGERTKYQEGRYQSGLFRSMDHIEWGVEIETPYAEEFPRPVMDLKLSTEEQNRLLDFIHTDVVSERAKERDAVSMALWAKGWLEPDMDNDMVLAPKAKEAIEAIIDNGMHEEIHEGGPGKGRAENR